MYSVSVIMPIYNNEKTLARAIDSILSQTIYDLELILVNDGSTDASAQICNAYAKSEPLLVEVIHQERAGLSLARNKGLYKSSGKYIYFADARDTFDSRMLQANIKLAEEKEAEMVVFGFKDLSENIDHLPSIPYLSQQEVFRNHYRNYHHFYPYLLCNKIYRRDFLRKNRIKFHKIPLKEEAFFNLRVYKDLNRVVWKNLM